MALPPSRLPPERCGRARSAVRWFHLPGLRRRAIANRSLCERIEVARGRSRLPWNRDWTLRPTPLLPYSEEETASPGHTMERVHADNRAPMILRAVTRRRAAAQQPQLLPVRSAHRADRHAASVERARQIPAARQLRSDAAAPPARVGRADACTQIIALPQLCAP